MSDSKRSYPRFRVRQTRGVAGRAQRVRRILEALGLGRIGRVREHNANPCVLGMIRKVEHLVTLERL